MSSTEHEPAKLDRSERRAYRQIVSLLSDSVWAIQLSVLCMIREIVISRLNGVHMSEDEMLEAIGGRRGRPQQETSGAVAIVPLRGVLVPHGALMGDVSNPGTGLDAWLEMFQAVVADPKVSDIVLDVDSPGGSAALVTETAAAVRAARAKKNVVAVANSTAASAAYAIACQADTFLCTPSGMVGSIGVYNIHEDMSAALEAEGVKPTIIQAPEGGYKTETNPFGPLSEEALQHMQEMVNSYYETFVNDVAAGRRVDANVVKENYGKGRLLTAKAALSAGLVDGVMSLDQVVTKLLAGKPLKQGARQEELGAAAIRGELMPAAGPITLSPSAAAMYGMRLEPVSGPLLADHVDVTSFGGEESLHDAVDAAVAAETPPEPAEAPEDAEDAGGAEEPAEEPADGDEPAAGDEPPAEEEPPPAPTEDSAAEPAAEHVHDPSSTAAATPAAPTTNEGGNAMEPVSFTDGRPPTLEELAATRDMHKARMGELNAAAAGRLFSDEEQKEFDELQAAVGLIDRTTENIKARSAVLQGIEPDNSQPGTGLGNGDDDETKRFQVKGPARVPDNIFDVAGYRAFARSVDELPKRWHDGAKRANELLTYETDDQDRVRGFVERLLKKDPSANPAESFAHRILLTGNPLYDAAFGKKVMGRQLTQGEEHLIRMAVSETGLGEEMPVPVTIDPTVILTSDGSTNPLRRLARNITITGPKWRGIASEGVTVEYEAELSEVADQTPDFTAPEAEVQKAHGWVEFSIEVDQDWGGFRSELTNMFADARDNKEANKFLHGTGTDEPEGLIWALDDDGGSVVDTESVGVLALTDVEALTNDLPPRFDQQGQWLANKAFYGSVRSLAAAEGTLDFWMPLSQSPSTPPPLLGYPTNSASEVSKLLSTGGEYVAVLGDFGRGFAIIDRIGLNVEVVSVVLGANRRPKGSRGLYVYYRNTSKLLAANAFRALRIKHS